MNIDPTFLNIALSVIGTVFSVMLGINAFFISRLVNKIDKAYEAANRASDLANKSEEKIKGIDRIIRELTELKSDIQLFKYIMVNNMGVKWPEKKES